MWTDQDRVDALVWSLEDSEKCPRCGTPRYEGMHPDHEDAYRVRRVQCHACKAVTDDINKLENHESTRFMYFIPEKED